MTDQAQTHLPWYRQFWPWVLIAIPLLTVIASGITLWLAVKNPDSLVVDDAHYDQIRSELRAQSTGSGDVSEAGSNEDDGQP